MSRKLGRVSRWLQTRTLRGLTPGPCEVTVRHKLRVPNAVNAVEEIHEPPTRDPRPNSATSQARRDQLLELDRPVLTTRHAHNTPRHRKLRSHYAQKLADRSRTCSAVRAITHAAPHLHATGERFVALWSLPGVITAPNDHPQMTLPLELAQTCYRRRRRRTAGTTPVPSYRVWMRAPGTNGRGLMISSSRRR